jgi:hypothetical protein
MSSTAIYREFKRRLIQSLANPDQGTSNDSIIYDTQQSQPRQNETTSTILGTYFNIQRRILKMKGFL